MSPFISIFGQIFGLTYNLLSKHEAPPPHAGSKAAASCLVRSFQFVAGDKNIYNDIFKTSCLFVA